MESSCVRASLPDAINTYCTMCEFNLLVGIKKLAIEPGQQSRGFGRVLLQRVLALAEKDHLNVALLSAEGSCSRSTQVHVL